jgi:hypothetical protein
LIDLGQRLEADSEEPISMSTILERARGLVGRDPTESAI